MVHRLVIVKYDSISKAVNSDIYARSSVEDNNADNCIHNAIMPSDYLTENS